MARHNGLGSAAHRRARLWQQATETALGQGAGGQAEECSEEASNAYSVSLKIEKEHHHHHHHYTTTTAAMNKGENQAPVKSKGVTVSDNEDNNNKEQEKEDQAAVAYLCTPIVAIDPRVRTFVTIFDTKGNMHEFGASSLE